MSKDKAAVDSMARVSGLSLLLLWFSSLELTLDNQTYDAGSQLPLLDDLWDLAFSSRATLEGQCYLTAGDLGVIKQQVDQTSGLYPNSVSQPSSRPSINANPQHLDPTFEPCQTDVSGGVPYGISSSDAHHSTNGPTHGYNRPNSRPVIPNLPYGYEGLSREYQYPLDEADTTAGIPRDPLKGLDVTNHADGSFFARSASDGLRSHLDSSWSANVFGDDMFVDFYGNNPVLTLVEHVDASAPEGSPNSSQEPSPPSLDASSLQTRFACHHPQCGGRTFSRRGDRDRHARVHDAARQYVCPRANCVMKFYRRDKLQSHLKNGH